MIVKFTRPLTTGESDDVVLEDGEAYTVLWATADSASLVKHDSKGKVDITLDQGEHTIVGEEEDNGGNGGGGGSGGNEEDIDLDEFDSSVEVKSGLTIYFDLTSDPHVFVV